MMAFSFFKAKVDLSKLRGVGKQLEKLGRGLTRDEADEVGKVAVKSMKDLIASGISPVKGGSYSARFPRYKNPKSYPGDRKNKSPVNLKLTGDFLNNLDYKVITSKSGYAAEIGYSDTAQKKKEQGHREGANGQPERPTIPAPRRGESFAASIVDAYRKVLLKAIDKVVKGQS